MLVSLLGLGISLSFVVIVAICIGMFVVSGILTAIFAIIECSKGLKIAGVIAAFFLMLCIALLII